MMGIFILIGSICAIGIWIAITGIKEQLYSVQQQLREIKEMQENLQRVQMPAEEREQTKRVAAAEKNRETTEKITEKKEERRDKEISDAIHSSVTGSILSVSEESKSADTVKSIKEKEREIQPQERENKAVKESAALAKENQSEKQKRRTTIQSVPQTAARPKKEEREQHEELTAQQKEHRKEKERNGEYTRQEREILQESRESFIGVLFRFFTSGNPVLKGGLIILFFGFGFLLKYSAEHNIISLELRVLAVFLTGAAMVAGSLFLLKKNPAQRYYALTLQGGGFGVMYITIFAAFRFYGMLPPAAGFTIQLLLVACCTFLALRQDSLPLVAFALCGGFLAPLLMRGGGNHLLLFSYCLLLNFGVVAIAWFRSWRVLNLLGFLATFSLFLFWTSAKYSPSLAFSTDIFLLLFFLLYLIVSILFALRQPLRLKGIIDATLIFALPCIVFSLQTAIIKHIEYGTAFSALAMAGIYFLAALFCHKKEMPQIFQIFRLTAFIFATISIPLAFDNSWSAPLWALEGSALLWFGIRNDTRRIAILGLLIELGAVCFFLLSLQEPPQWTIARVIDSRCFNEILFACAFMVSSYLIDKSDKKFPEYDSSPFLFWFAVLAWAAAGRHLFYQIDGTTAYNLFLIYWTISIAVFYRIQPAIEWQRIALLAPTLSVLILLLFIWRPVSSSSVYSNYLGSISGCIGWSMALTMHCFLLNLYEEFYREKEPLSVDMLHIGTLCVSVAVIAMSCASFVAKAITPGWGEAVGILVISGVVAEITYLRERFFIFFLQEKFQEYGQRAWLKGSAFFAALLAMWSFYISFTVKMSATNYTPIFNAAELPQIFIFITLIFWLKKEDEIIDKELQKKLSWGLAAILFTAFNAAIARFFHYGYGVPFTVNGLLTSTPYQAVVAVIWGIISLTLTVYASLRNQRQLWMIGAALIGLVAAKLFLVDLAGTGTLARIIAFLAVGVLMLIIGYFSPLPPSEKE